MYIHASNSTRVQQGLLLWLLCVLPVVQEKMVVHERIKVHTALSYIFHVTGDDDDGFLTTRDETSSPLPRLSQSILNRGMADPHSCRDRAGKVGANNALLILRSM
jgi:hypothetical protein